MKERGLPFQPDMALATYEDRKTNTRRVVKVQPNPTLVAAAELIDDVWYWLSGHDGAITGQILGSGLCPYGYVGDRLWVREPWRTDPKYDKLPPRSVPRDAPIWYIANGTTVGKYRHGRFMCRWMSRTLLEVTGVRVERLQEIKDEDAKAEGAPLGNYGDAYTIPQQLMNAGTFPEQSHVYGFQQLWGAINGHESWLANPWVWVVAFKRVPQ